MPKIDEAPKKKKKGRPTKKDSIVTPPVEKIPKKRGRKPKGGKIISNVSQTKYYSTFKMWKKRFG